MKKIAIMTIQSINLGNRLQNYALQESIKYLGLDVFTVQRERPLLSVKMKLISMFNNYIREIIGTRGGLYHRFNRKNINFSKYYATANEYEEGIEQHFDYFIAGSDQIWNPYYAVPEKDLVGVCDLLVFAKSCQKISYAASFGVSILPQEKKELYTSALKDFSALSVREESGAKMIRELTGREADIVLDPTLLLSAGDWYKISRKPFHLKMKKNYALVYALGEDDRNIYNELSCAERQCVIDILKKDKNGRYPAVGPSEFLYLIAHAERVLTNSFHATVFAILFHKPVRTFPRKGIDMSSRIVSLAELLGIREHFTEDGIFYLEHGMDYEEIEKRIEKAKINSLNYLKNALK